MLCPPVLCFTKICPVGAKLFHTHGHEANVDCATLRNGQICIIRRTMGTDKWSATTEIARDFRMQFCEKYRRCLYNTVLTPM
jgi:hypothetical protein